MSEGFQTYDKGSINPVKPYRRRGAWCLNHHPGLHRVRKGGGGEKRAVTNPGPSSNMSIQYVEKICAFIGGNMSFEENMWQHIRKSIFLHRNKKKSSNALKLVD